jgi:hypothetical protein
MLLVFGPGMSMLAAGEIIIDCDGCQCASCNDGSLDDCPSGSGWRFYAGAILLDRSSPGDLPLMQDTTDPTRQLNADDFHFGFEAGWDTSLAYRMARGSEVEARFFIVDSWNEAAAVATNSTLLNPLRINNNPPTFAGATQTIDANLGSDLLSVEVNWLEPVHDNWSLILGFRHAELDELLHAQLNAGPQTFLYDTTTANRLDGFQLGAASRDFCLGHVLANASLKAGIYHNSADHVTTFNTGVVTQTASGSASDVSFLGELAVAVKYCVTEGIAVRAGYNVIWLESVALAPDQIPATDLFTGTGISNGGSVFYHGAVFGVEIGF